MNPQTRIFGGIGMKPKYQYIDLPKFHRNYQINETSGCWEWIGSTFQNRGGYGRFHIGRIGYRAHRVSWLVHHMVWPVGKLVCHKCDNPSCVNPNHLFLGTERDNILDMVRKGRKADVSGERHGMAKLSETQVREILKRVSNGEVQRRLAFEYGISPALVCCLVKGKKWRHLRE